MDMTVKMYHPVIISRPLCNRIMAEKYLAAAVAYGLHMADALKAFNGIRILHDPFVVIAYYEMLFALQLNEIIDRFLLCRKTKITYDIYLVFVRHDRIPVIYQSAVHLFRICKWTAAQSDNILMSEMKISNVIDHFSYSDFFPDMIIESGYPLLSSSVKPPLKS